MRNSLSFFLIIVLGALFSCTKTETANEFEADLIIYGGTSAGITVAV